MNRRKVGAAAGIALLGGIGAASVWWPVVQPPRREGSPDQTDMILIVIDTLRADHLGAWGYERPTSPHLDALAAQGVRFSALYAACSWTRPAMGTLLTGRYGRELGLYEERFDALPDDAVTLAERLHESGYKTLGVTANPNINASFGFDQGFDVYGDSTVIFRFMEDKPGYTKFNRKTNALEGAAEVTDRALALVDEHGLSDTVPLYLQVLYIDPHVPTDPPEAHRLAIGDIPDRVTLYDGEIHYVDAEVRRLLDGLAERGVLDNALVVVTSDHGEGLDDHPGLPLAGSHGHTLYDSTVHVPLIVSHPELPKGLVVDDLVSQVDLVPTFLDLLGVTTDTTGLPGHSLAALARGEGTPPALPPFVFFETDWRYTDKIGVRGARYKYLRNDDATVYQADGTHEQLRLEDHEKTMLELVPPEEFYGWGEPKEIPRYSQDRVPGHPVQKALTEAVEAWESRTRERPPLRRSPRDVLVLGDGTVLEVGGAEPTELDEETRGQLEALGYMGD